jgi:hypothetical protein
VLVIFTCRPSTSHLTKIKERSHHVIERSAVGRDFGSHKMGLAVLLPGGGLPVNLPRWLERAQWLSSGFCFRDTEVRILPSKLSISIAETVVPLRVLFLRRFGAMLARYPPPMIVVSPKYAAARRVRPRPTERSS